MKTRSSNAETVYGPLEHKCFAGALEAFFAQQCPQVGGPLLRKPLVARLVEMFDAFHPETARVRQGQLQWVTVRKDCPPSRARRICDCDLIAVTLDVVRPQDILDLKAGRGLRTLKREAVARILRQADAQGGCMACTEVSAILKISPRTVNTYIREWEEAHDEVLPRRGTTHDLGPTLTHKAEIVRMLFLEGHSVEDVARATHHAVESVHRYIDMFKRVLLLHTKGLSASEITFGLHIGKRLLVEYEKLIMELGSENPLFERLLTLESKGVDSCRT
jgi:hypothetical protein